MSVRVHLTGSPDGVGMALEQLCTQNVEIVADETTWWVLAPAKKSRDVREVIAKKLACKDPDLALLHVCAAIYPGLCWEITDASNVRLPEVDPCQHGNYRRDLNSWDIFEERSSTLYSFKAVKGRYEHAWVDSGIIMRHYVSFARAVTDAFQLVYVAENAQQAKDALDEAICEINVATNDEYERVKRVYEDIRASLNASLPD